MHASPRASGISRAHLHFSTRDHLIATWSNVVILIWRKETTGVGVAGLQSVYDNHALQNRSGVFLTTIVEEQAETPTQEIRKALARFLEKGGGRTLLSAVVHEGSGFRAAFVRSIVTGVSLLAKLPYPHKVFSSVNEATVWFRVNAPVPQAWTEEDLLEAIRELRARNTSPS
jgi:hypothetical protein